MMQRTQVDIDAILEMLIESDARENLQSLHRGAVLADDIQLGNLEAVRTQGYDANEVFYGADESDFDREYFDNEDQHEYYDEPEKSDYHPHDRF